MNSFENEEKIRTKFLECYDQYNDAIFRYCYFHTGSRETSLDLVQEAFLRTWEYMKNGHVVLELKPFVFHITRNLVIDEWRKKSRTNISLDSLTENGFDLPFDDKENMLDRDDFARLLEQMNQLSNEYREVLMLRFVEDLAVKEIAGIIHETENATSVRIHRAIEKLKELLPDSNLNL